MTLYFGIDPGLHGGLVAVDETGKYIWGAPMPLFKKTLDVQTLRATLIGSKIAFVAMEKVSARPGQGVVSMFHFGYSAGILEGMLAVLQIPYSLVAPATWTKAMCEGVDKSMAAKDRSRVAAMRLFPEVSFLATGRSKKPHDGLIDASLLALYGMRKSLGA